MNESTRKTRLEISINAMNHRRNSYIKTARYKIVPSRFSKVTSTFPNFPGETLESTLRANKANRVIWVKGLTLIEMLVAVTIFSVLSVSMYLLLNTGISVRKKIESREAQILNINLKLDKLSQEIRNIVFFSEDDSGFRGNELNIEFYTLLFDYNIHSPKISKISYFLNQGVLSKKIEVPFKEQNVKEYGFIDGLEKINFSYFMGNGNDEDAFRNTWENIKNLPKGIKISLLYKDKSGKKTSFEKYVLIPRHNEFR